MQQICLILSLYQTIIKMEFTSGFDSNCKEYKDILQKIEALNDGRL